MTGGDVTSIREQLGRLLGRSISHRDLGLALGLAPANGTRSSAESGRQMSGLRMICKLYGGMKITQDGKTVNYVWDYAADEPVPDAEMPVGSERWNASERAKRIKTEMH